MLSSAGLCGGAVVVRNDPAELLFPFDLAFRSRREIDIENFIADLLVLVGDGCGWVSQLKLIENQSRMGGFWLKNSKAE